jgi:hypothetical protein
MITLTAIGTAALAAHPGRRDGRGGQKPVRLLNVS